MEAYVFAGDLLCTDCAEEYMRSHNPPPNMNPDDESTWDSDDWPKGPYPNGGGDADCPHHCVQCGRFLENPLTHDGEQYVRDAVEAGAGPCVNVWRSSYGYLFE